MTVPTLQSLIEEKDYRKPVIRIVIGGAPLPKWSSCNYQFAIGEVPTATITVPNRNLLPLAVAEEASVEIWFGIQVGFSLIETIVFGGAVVDSVGYNGSEVLIECVMDGPRKLSYGYNRRINYDFSAVEAQDAVIDLLTLAGVQNYYVELTPWVLGTAVPQEIEFSTYGEAINKIAEVDGSPWYALPSGMVRVETRDPIPSESWRRTYFSGYLTGPVETAPTAITNLNARPRINDIQLRKFRNEVGNFIHVEGAVVVEVGPNGEQNSHQIVETVDGESGSFPNGAHWIPTPPLFQDFIFSNELIDTNAKAFEVAERYFDLKNRLFESIPLPVPGDPDVFLGETVRVLDPAYSGTASNYFVKGYRTSITESDCVTELNLTGGPESGTTGFASPFAEFFWKYSAAFYFTGGGAENLSGLDLGPGADLGSKLCEDVPEETGDEDQRGTDEAAPDQNVSAAVTIAIDGSMSQDFDGQIVAWDWEWTDSADVVHNLSGPRITLVFDPSVQSTVEVKLTVTDDSERTGEITKTIFTSAEYPDIPGGYDEDPDQNDTPEGGGVALGPCTEPPEEETPTTPPSPPDNPNTGTPPPGACNGMMLGYFIAARAYAMGSVNNHDWNDLTKEAAGVAGDFISVGAGFISRNQKSYAIFGTDQGEVVLTDDFCETGEKVFDVPGAPRIECIFVDTLGMGQASEGSAYGTENPEGLPSYTEGAPGTLTIMEAYQFALAAGFAQVPAIIAVAIMMAESGLLTNATNSNPGPPASTDRGVAQINDYYHPTVTDACAFNPACAIREMFRISGGGSDFTPWAAFNAGTHTQFISQVRETVGYKGAGLDDFTGGGSTNTSIKSLKVWMGTSNGKLYKSEDSGRTWTLIKDYGPNHPIYQIITDVRFSGQGVMVFGGDTSNIESLVQVLLDESGNSKPLLPQTGELAELIKAASTGHSIRAAAINDTALMIGFNSGISPSVWTTLDGEEWTPSIGYPNGVRTAARGFDGSFLIA